MPNFAPDFNQLEMLSKEELEKTTVAMAFKHVQISEGGIPKDEDSLDDVLEDMWHYLGVSGFQKRSRYRKLDIYALISELGLRAIYMKNAKEAMIKRYNLTF